MSGSIGVSGKEEVPIRVSVFKPLGSGRFVVEGGAHGLRKEVAYGVVAVVGCPGEPEIGLVALERGLGER